MLKRLALSLLAVTAAIAQNPARLVETIVINTKGNVPMSEQAVRGHISVAEGKEFSQAELDKSIRGLFATGSYDNVQALPEDVAEGKVRVTFTLTGKAKVRTVSFEGNSSIKGSKLAKEITLKANSLLDTETLQADAQKIKVAYQKKNFPKASAVTRVTSLENGTLSDVTFVVNEGEKAAIDKITFSGNTHVSAKELKKALITKEGSWFSFLTGSGKVEDNAITEDVDRLTEMYRNLGYLEVAVAAPTLSNPNGKGSLHFDIVEGAHYVFGKVSFAGNNLFGEETLKKALKVAPGQSASPAAIEATTAAIRDLYGAKGCVDTVVRGNLSPAAAGVMDVAFAIQESPVYKVGAINVEGNTTTKSIVVAREINLAPGDVFDTTKMKVSEARLKNTGYFESVKLTDETSQTSPADQRDLNVAITEGKTGNFSFGAGISSLDKSSVFAEFTQGNFDLLNRKNFFRGDGQKFRLYTSLGQESSQVILNFEEPWLFDQRVAAGFSLYRTSNGYESDDYDEKRAGFEVYLRKRLVELIDARLAYRRETVELYDFADDVSPVISAEGGERTVSKITLTLTRDHRDKVVNTTRGSRYELTTSIAGKSLGGDTDYWSIEGRAAQYYPTTNWWVPQNLAILARAGTMDSFGDQRVPLFDRFFLGGPESVRGFDYRSVGPKASATDDEPTGGKTYGFLGLEYTFQLHEIFSLACFYDAGFVNKGTADFSTGDYNDSWGVGARLLIMGAPMRLDYALPITSDEQNDDGGKFWFSFGTRF